MSERTELPIAEEPQRPDWCETCRFRCRRLLLGSDGLWIGEEPLSEHEYEKKYEPSGECRRRSPSTYGHSLWPIVGLNYWCGEWEAGNEVYWAQKIAADDLRRRLEKK